MIQKSDSMKYSQVDKCRVFLAYRAIFNGQNAQVRRRKKVLELVNSHRSPFEHMIRDLGVNRLVEILRVLLDSRTFESELRAKVEFPELFRSSPDREVQRTRSENNAAVSESQALQEIEILGGRGGADVVAEELQQSLTEVSKNAGNSNPITARPGESLPSFYPSYLPYSAQHYILTTTQRLLEESCYEFAERWLPEVLQEHGWDCPAAVELSQWPEILGRRAPNLATEALDLDGLSFTQILSQISRIRHTAVHRLPTTARGIGQLVCSALRLAEALRDSLRAAQLKDLQSEIDNKIKAMELVKNNLEDRLHSQVQELCRQREELDRKEKEIIATAVKEDLDNRALIGHLLEESVHDIVYSQFTPQTESSKDQDRLETDEEDGVGSVDTVQMGNGSELPPGTYQELFE